MGERQDQKGASMSVTAISGIFSLTPDSSDRQSETGQTKDGLRSALNAGNLALAQQAITGLQQDINAPQNGVRAAASDNPQSTLRVDQQALQEALDSGDLAAAQQSFLRIIEDSQQIADAQRSEKSQPGALPNSESSDPNDSSAASGGVGSLIDVMA
jgi:hypothetical protein